MTTLNILLQAANGGAIGSFLPLILIFLVMWLCSSSFVRLLEMELYVIFVLVTSSLMEFGFFCSSLRIFSRISDFARNTMSLSKS